MRMTRIVIGCVLALVLVALPALVSAESTPTPAHPAKTPARASKTLAKAPARTPAKVTPPKDAPRSLAPAERVVPPLAPIPPVPAKAPSFAPAASTAAPALPAVPIMPAAPSASTAPAFTPPAEAVPAAATPAVPVTPESLNRPAVPYAGYINADVVNVRSGPAMYYYPLANLNKDTPVMVEAESPGWLAIRPIEGVYGLVKKSDLAMGTSGATATVSAPSARMYAASNAAKRHWCVMATLKQGDVVKVLGPADEEMVRAACPDGGRVYVSAQFVTAGAAPSSGAIGQIAKMEIEPPKPDPLVEDFKKAETALSDELKKPITDRDYAPLITAFKEVGEKAEKAYLKRSALERVAYLEALHEQRSEYMKVVGIGDRLNQRLADMKAKEATEMAEAERERKAAKPEFLATGVVARLESLEDVDYPIKYKLVDEKGHPLYVLKSTTIDLSKYVGKAVGIRGTKAYLKDWRIYLVTVDELEVLE